MIKPISVLLVSALVLTSCGTVRESRFNPFNWFGRGVSEPVANADSTVNPLIPRRRANIFRQEAETAYRGTPVAEITELLIERRPGGAILRTTGLANRLGPFDVRLVPVAEESDGATLTYTLSALQQPGPRNTGPRARQITAALWLTDQQLAGVRTIRVRGLTNIRTARR
ncbi:hypothetical protein [Aestuariicoccus sp. MJ-SS9]|uniref:hypothetical protein n=1 Tax=Aestuariicoccus sp. MJ-SS9 TaxID=3079855 RepID=UPI00290E65EA|nr:hypothetical protein [Aestuariicoccus sp. MJ-SS9]MDU8912061.1 hypothetical protein [Aestuariicoccus sp. MJ-SS9]